MDRGDLQGWYPDPFGRHEARYFSNGQPTKLVRDGESESYDAPPSGEWAWSTPPASQSAAERSSAVRGQPPLLVQPEDRPSLSGSTSRTRWSVRRRLALASAVVLVVGVVAGVALDGHSSPHRASESPQRIVLTSLNQTIAKRTATVGVSLTVDIGAQQVTASGAGAIDLGAGALLLNLAVAVPNQARRLTIREVWVGRQMYEQLPQIQQLIPGKSWLAIDPSQGLSAGGGGAGDLGGVGNPAAMLRLLAQQGATVTTIGGTEIDQVAVTGYRVIINRAVTQKILSSKNVPSWLRAEADSSLIDDATESIYIDDSGHLRRLAVDATVAGNPQITIDETIDLSNYGAPVSIAAPPANEVISLQQLLSQAPQSTF